MTRKSLFVLLFTLVAFSILGGVCLSLMRNIKKNIAGIAIDSDKKVEYLLMETSYKKKLYLPFVASESDLCNEFYRSSIFGVNILGLSVDGRPLEPKQIMVIFDDIDHSVISTNSQRYIYLLNTNTFDESVEHWTLVFNKNVNNLPDIWEYTIPKKSSIVKIDYKINQPCSKSSQKNTLNIRIE